MNKKAFKDFALYAVVGAVATLCEWLIFHILSGNIHLHFLVSTAIAYIISTFVNWLFGRLLVFKSANKKVWLEISEVYLASVVGLLLNLALMELFVAALTLDEMLSKMMATALVFLYNFLARKLFIYKK